MNATETAPGGARPPSILPPPRPPWLGAVVASAAVAGLRFVGDRAGLGRSVAWVPCLGHWLAIAATITLLQEAIAQARLRRELAEDEAPPQPRVGGWPRKALAAALAPIDRQRHSQAGVESALESARRDMAARLAVRWWAYIGLAFAVPLAGLCAGWRNLATDTNLFPMADLFQPLAVGWLEALPVAALACVLYARGERLMARWAARMKGIARKGTPLLDSILDGQGQPSASGAPAGAVAERSAEQFVDEDDETQADHPAIRDVESSSGLVGDDALYLALQQFGQASQAQAGPADEGWPSAETWTAPEPFDRDSPRRGDAGRGPSE